MVRERRRTRRLPPSYYIAQRETLAETGRTAPNTAANTQKGLNSTLVKWNSYCRKVGQDPEIFLQQAQVPDFKVFWKWTLDTYKGLQTASTLRTYWRTFRMYILDKADRELDPRERRDIHNYLNLLTKEYGLRKTPKKKPVIDLDDLYLLLYTHWALDERTFDGGEYQGVQVSAGLLAAAYFGCRPCSLFDTRVNFDDEKLPSNSQVDQRQGGDNTKSRRRRSCGTAIAVHPDLTVNSDSSTAYDSDNETDLGSINSDTEDDSDTNDDVDTGAEVTRAFLYRHFAITIVPHGTPGAPNIVFMKVTLLHTEGEDNNPRIKTMVIDGEDDDPMFCLLDHFISLAIYDDAFEAESAKEVVNMFWVKMPPGKKSLTLKWKRRVLDLPVFREPSRGVGETGTSPTEPLRASTWIRYLKKLGRTAGFQHSFTQYGLRRGLLNVVNNNAPAAVRDQIFDHKHGAVRYYLDQEVRFDTKACYLGRPSNEVVQKMARLASLTADVRAPTALSLEQKAKLDRDTHIIQLSLKNKALTAQIRAAGFKSISAAEGTPLFDKKKKVQARLNCRKTRLRSEMVNKARKRYLREHVSAYWEDSK